MYHNKKILLVDDEVGLLDMLKIILTKERFTDITTATTAIEALEKIKKENYDLLLLDVNLPDFSGFELCTQIRQFSYVPIIFLTACDGNLDKITGLALGGDDYIVKPFDPLEVVARIKTILRRQTQYVVMTPVQSETPVHNAPTVFDYGTFQVNLSDATLTVNGEQIQCTATEFELLSFFCQNPNHVFTSTQLYESVWNEIGYKEDKTVSIYISKLRKKLNDDPKSPSIILNLRGIGYKFVPPKRG